MLSCFHEGSKQLRARVRVSGRVSHHACAYSHLFRALHRTRHRPVAALHAHPPLEFTGIGILDLSCGNDFIKDPVASVEIETEAEGGVAN
jgi:hypothetical protein